MLLSKLAVLDKLLGGIDQCLHIMRVCAGGFDQVNQGCKFTI